MDNLEHPLDREAANRECEARRPKADKMYLAEAAQALNSPEQDGRNLTDVLQNIAEEMDALLMAAGRTRELALCKTKIEEAWLWAIRHGQLHASHHIIDRRVFRIPGEEENK